MKPLNQAFYPHMSIAGIVSMLNCMQCLVSSSNLSEDSQDAINLACCIARKELATAKNDVQTFLNALQCAIDQQSTVTRIGLMTKQELILIKQAVFYNRVDWYKLV